ncbi:hypothetical protein CEXT_725861 [Caerostris extrusa]|uniref:Uncharacterized protein n=1 Tax=Caerostris extrusa TaxID=172846 RepID=A0AAV4QLC4_CAEEX|nr:hypothetical protein CEXT_725861 [Caerostris extrusa]
MGSAIFYPDHAGSQTTTSQPRTESVGIHIGNTIRRIKTEIGGKAVEIFVRLISKPTTYTSSQKRKWIQLKRKSSLAQNKRLPKRVKEDQVMRETSTKFACLYPEENLDPLPVVLEPTTSKGSTSDWRTTSTRNTGN